MIRSVVAFGCGLLLSATMAVAQPAPRFGTWGVDLSSMDPSVKPGDNFFQHVNGGWLKTAVIPPDRAQTGSFLDLQILSERRLNTIVMELEQAPDQRLTPEERKLRDLYKAFMDTAAIEARGLTPVRKDLDYLQGLKTPEDVAQAMGSVRLSTPTLFTVVIAVDEANPDNYSINLGQSGLGMPDRDYYLLNGTAWARAAYRKYLADMMTLAGLPDADARADRVLALETKIASASWGRADRNDRNKIYNPMPISALKTLAPDFPWAVYLSESGIPLQRPDGRERTVVVLEKSAFAPLAAIFGNTPVSTWRDYLTVHYLRYNAPYLPRRFDDLVFSFYGTRLTGRPRQLDRQTRAVHLLDQRMGDALGKLYAARHFPADARSKANLLAVNLRKTYETGLRTLDWMAPATRDKALAKLRQLTVKIGYPDRWRDYSALEILPGDLVGNVQRLTIFAWNRDVGGIDQPVDRGEWVLTPSSINAYYNPNLNEVVFPAGILQPPFFDPGADDAVNYGAIGALMATEIGETIGPAGSNNDGRGAPSNWWTREDWARFNSRTALLAKQYDAFEPLPGLHINGKNTLEQNIADNMGLAVALQAYHLSRNGREPPVIDGYTGDQRLLLSFGQVWRAKMRENAIRAQTISNEHTVAEFRVIGPTRNMDAWYDAFDVKPGEKYYLAPDQRVHLW